ncbi:MAG: hypothetical protein AAFX00_14540, partial [Pseudomonadota bacterium]
TALYSRFLTIGWLEDSGDTVHLTEEGRAGLAAAGFDPDPQPRSRAPLCRPCLDWSERQRHLGGRLGRGLLAEMERRHWVRRDPQSRAIHFSAEGTRAFRHAFGVRRPGGQCHSAACNFG